MISPESDRAPDGDRGGGKGIEKQDGKSPSTTSAAPRQTILSAALKYTVKVPVFPGDPKTKRPLVKHGFKDASKDQEQIRAWWTRWPDAIICMPTGRASGFIVLDIDVKNGQDGRAALAELERQHGPLPKTLTAETPSGGLHLYFTMPDTDPPLGNSAGKLGPGIDVRGEGGYIVLPPSRINGRAYKWVAYE